MAKKASESMNGSSPTSLTHQTPGTIHKTDAPASASAKDTSGETITQIGLLVNLLSAFLKALGGYLFHSDALITDAFHSATDLVADIVTLATIFFSRKNSKSSSADSCSSSSGIWNVETIGSLAVSGFIFSGGLGMGWKGVSDLYQHFNSPIIPILSGHEQDVTDPLAAVVAAASVAAKEWLYRSTMTIARRQNSPILASNAIHHRIDSLSSVVALVAIAGAYLFPSAASWLDPAGTCVIAAMVLHAGWNNVWETLGAEGGGGHGHGH